jgi:hypothetical protein
MCDQNQHLMTDDMALTSHSYTDKFCHIVSWVILKTENELEAAASAKSCFCLFNKQNFVHNCLQLCICIYSNI